MRQIYCFFLISLVCLIFFSTKTMAVDSLFGYDSHPNYWPAGNSMWTAKKYLRAFETPNPGFDVVWAWSGQQDNFNRYLIYQAYRNNQPAEYREWELWQGDAQNHLASVYSYGGPDEMTSSKVFLNQEKCQQGVGGISWPNLENNTIFQSTTESAKDHGVCTRNGYIAVSLHETWSEPFSELRTSKCNQYIPYAVSSNGNQICRSALSVGSVYQRYARGNTLSNPTPSYYLGCEATIYAWGYPNASDGNYKNWFRNGELRWSDYIGIGASPNLKAPDDQSWWNSACEAAWTQVPNWIYSGTYKLNNNEYTDFGSQPTPTSTPTPTPIPPTSTPTPTKTSTPSPTPMPKPGDLNADGKVDIFDYNILVANFGHPYAIFDYNVLVGNFGK